MPFIIRENMMKQKKYTMNFPETTDNSRTRQGIRMELLPAFQLYEIAREKKEEGNSLGILLNLYKQIREGNMACQPACL